MYHAYKAGRSEKDPSESWYKGEMGFFDFYLIPLTKKLKNCGVFGVSSDEYLNYAQANRKEWEARGQEVVSDMLAKMEQHYGGTTTRGNKETVWMLEWLYGYIHVFSISS